MSFTVAIRVSYTDIVYVTRYKLVFVQYDSNDSSIDNFVVGESSRPFPLSLGPVFTFRDRAVLVFYYLLEYTCTYDTSKCEFLSSTSLPFESDGTRTLEATAINNEIPGRQATSGQLEASTLSVRVFYQFAGTIPCCICVVLLLTRSTKQCHAAAIRVNPSQNNTSKYEPSHSLHSNK